MSQEPVMRCEGLVKTFRMRSAGRRYGHRELRAVDGVDLELRRGEILGLVGESGCGKSTLARIVTMLDAPTSGRVLLDGTDVHRASSAYRRGIRRRIQLVFQDPIESLHPRMTALQAVIEPWRVHKDMVPKGERRARALELLRRVGLSESQGHQYPHELSGGQAQRVAIARALALEPDVLICDEPVASLDVSIRAQVLNLIRDLRDELGLSCLFISHDLATVRYVADRIAVMYLGRVVEVGSGGQVFGDATHPYTEALLSAVPVPEPRGRRQSGRILLADEASLSPGLGTGCRFRPRCWLAEDRCASEEPALAEVALGHSAACWVRVSAPTPPTPPTAPPTAVQA